MPAHTTQTRAKFAYLKYESMLSNLLDDTLNPKKRLNAYDINFAPDTKECYVIAPDLTPWAVKSKVYTFDSVESANDQLNQNTDTYSGQIVAIQNGEKYFGYIVNKNTDGFYVSPLSEQADSIDDNELGNRPIINLIGTLDEPIMVSDLDTGIYKIKGQYKVSILEETIYLSASDTLFIVNNNRNNITIKKITTDEIVDYIISDDSLISNRYITQNYLKENGYATTSYVDLKMESLETMLRKDIQEYIMESINVTMGGVLDEKIDQKVDEKLNEYIQPTSDEQISGLFNN